jgi:hypothetical protein
MVKNMTELLMLIIEKNKCKNWGRAKREALISGNYEMLPPLAKKKFQKNENNS